MCYVYAVLSGLVLSTALASFKKLSNCIILSEILENRQHLGMCKEKNF